MMQINFIEGNKHQLLSNTLSPYRTYKVMYNAELLLLINEKTNEITNEKTSVGSKYYVAIMFAVEIITQSAMLSVN